VEWPSSNGRRMRCISVHSGPIPTAAAVIVIRRMDDGPTVDVFSSHGVVTGSICLASAPLRGSTANHTTNHTRNPQRRRIGGVRKHNIHTLEASDVMTAERTYHFHIKYNGCDGNE